MTVQLFGKSDAPCVANYGLKKCAKDQSNNFDAKALECVEKDFYMDNFLKSNDSEKYLLTLSKEHVEMLSSCSFRFKKWFSNSSIVMTILPQSDLFPKFNSFHERIVERVLGIL